MPQGCSWDLAWWLLFLCVVAFHSECFIAYAVGKPVSPPAESSTSLTLYVTKNATDSSCSITDPLSSSTVPMCGLEICPCADIQPAIDSASLLLDIAVNATSVDVTVSTQGKSSVVEVALPTSGAAEVLISPAVYKGTNNTQLEIIDHNISLRGTSATEVVIAGTYNVSTSAPVVLLENCGSCSISNAVLWGFHMYSADPALCLIGIWSSNVTLSNVTVSNVYGGLGSKTVLVGANESTTALVVRNMTVIASSLRNLFYTESATFVDVEGLTMENLSLENMGKFLVPSHSALRLVDIELVKIRQMSASTRGFTSVAFVGQDSVAHLSQFTLRSCLMSSASFLHVSASSSASHSVEAPQWSLEHHNSNGILFEVADAGLVLDHFTASNSTIGTLVVTSSSLQITNAMIENCGMRLASSASPTLRASASTWTIANSTFSRLQNSESFIATEHFRNTNSLISLSGVTFENSGPGAVIEAIGVSVTIKESELISNSQNFDITSLDSLNTFTLSHSTVIQSDTSLRGDFVRGSTYLTSSKIQSIAVCSAMTITQGRATRTLAIVEDCEFEDYALVFEVPDVTVTSSDFMKSIASVSSSQLVGSLLFSAGVENAVVSNCSFTPSTSQASSGGSIAVGTPSTVLVDASDSPMTVLITNCQFMNKTGYQGGALRANGGDLFISDCSFVECNASAGGAVFVTSGFLSIHNTSFYRNSAIQFGGDVFIGGDARVFLDDLHMRTSFSESLGGSLYIESSASGLVSGLKFFNCSASTGAAIASAGENTVTFVNCEARQGYAIASGGGFSTHQKAANAFYGCYFTLNQARSYGAALFTSDRSTPEFYNCTIQENRAETSGGGIYSQDTSLIIVVNCTFDQNRASSGGGAIMLAVDSHGVISDTSMALNSANGVGGAIAGIDRTKFLVTNVTFEKNWSGNGGGLHFSQHSTAVVKHCDFGNHTSRSYGGACSLVGSSIATFEHCCFESNFVGVKSGGAISSTDLSTLTVNNCTFVRNSGAAGGAIFFDSPHLLTVELSSFWGNFAPTKGGAIRTGDYVLSDILSCHFEGNQSGGPGGAIFYSNTTGAGLINCTFVDNVSLAAGGAVAAVEATLKTEFCRFTDNTAATSGGAIALYDSPRGRIFDSEFVGNNCTYGRGGAVYLDTLRISMRRCYLEGNSATFGGALFVVLPFHAADVRSQHTNVTFVENFSLSDGGAVALGGSSGGSSVSYSLMGDSDRREEVLVITDFDTVVPLFRECEFLRNTALGSGGAISIQDYAEGQLQLLDVSLQENYAAHYGGAIFTRQPSGVGLLVNSTLLYNTAAWGGSTIAFERVTDVSETNSFACTNCTIELLPKQYATNIGYGNYLGYATPPELLSYADSSSCPSSVALNGEPFSLTLGMRDGFSTPVYGQLFLDTSYSVQFNSSGNGCHVVTPPDSVQHINETGVACFHNITLEGYNNSTCSLKFSTDSRISSVSFRSDVDSEVTCIVALGGCLDGLVVEEGVSSDTCEEPPLWGVFIILGLLLILLLLTCVLIGVVLVHQYQARQKRIEEGYYEALEIDDILRDTSLEDILNNPDIHRIPWNELEVGERIGLGASGIVTAAHWTRDGTTTEVALKELLLEFEEMEAEAVKNFIVEIKLMRALRHRRVVSFEGIAYHDGRLYLVTELMENGSVRDVLTKKGANCSFKLRTKFLYDAALGMEFLHSKKLIHRDLKPQNILVNRNWVCKIADFGVSTIKNNTCTMTAVGTPIYMAPEVLNNERYGEAVDAYSFGILMVEVYTGRRPYSDLGLNDAQLMFKIYHENLRPSTEGLHPLVEQMVAETLHKDPGLRPSFREIVMRLKRLSKLDVEEKMPQQGSDDSWLMEDTEIHLSSDSTNSRPFSIQDETPV